MYGASTVLIISYVAYAVFMLDSIQIWQKNCHILYCIVYIVVSSARSIVSREKWHPYGSAMYIEPNSDSHINRKRANATYLFLYIAHKPENVAS